MILGGDFNARVGDLNNNYDEEMFSYSGFFTSRISKDKRVDNFGRHLVDMFEDRGFILLNGRILWGNTLFTGDLAAVPWTWFGLI